MDANRTYSGAGLKSELARYCLPAAKRDASRNLAWTNSICILFLIIGLIGINPNPIALKPLPPSEEAIPIVVEPLATPPPAADQAPNDQNEPDRSDAPRVVVVTPNSPAINFSVPTIGNLVVPNAIAVAPPPVALRHATPAAPQPTTVSDTGRGGERPAPDYPRIAQDAGQQGTVILLINVDETGTITSVDIKESSGYPILDRNARDFLRRHWIFPPGRRVYEAPIHYKL